MNHGYYGVFDKYISLVLSHQKFATDKPLILRAQVYQWQTSSDLRLGSYPQAVRQNSNIVYEFLNLMTSVLEHILASLNRFLV